MWPRCKEFTTPTLLNEEASLLEFSRVHYKYDLLKYRGEVMFQVSLYM
jgi:hypothetical protein